MQCKQGRRKSLKPLAASLAWWATPCHQFESGCAFLLAYCLGAVALMEKAQIPIAQAISLNSRGTWAKETGNTVSCSAVLLCGLWVTSSWHSLPKAGGCRHWLMVGNELSPPWKDMETEQDYMSYSRARRKNGVKSGIRVKVLQQEAPSSRLACCLAQCGHNPAEAPGQHSRMHQHELLIPAQCPTQ